MIIERFMIGEVRSNCYLMIDEISGEAAVIDCGDSTDELLEALKSPLIKKVKYILLTHGHFDHICGSAKIKSLTHAEICIHEYDADCLLSEERSLIYRHFPNMQEFIEADRLISDGDLLKLGENEIKVLHTPGHSKGSVSFLCGDLLFTGDTLFARMIGRTDFEDSDDDEMNESLRKLFNLPGEYTIYPGHNRSTTMNEERQTNRGLRRLK